nr:hypothetical protein [Bradyrhizobium sp. JYMT SZCCT0428]
MADDAWHISAASAIVDGEVVVPAADGTTDFSVLQNELKGKSSRIVLVAFDLLYLNGYDLRKLPLMEHKAHLKKLIAATDIQFSESFETDGREIYKHACKVGPEGLVSQCAIAPMRPAAVTTNEGIVCAKRTVDRSTVPSIFPRLIGRARALLMERTSQDPVVAEQVHLNSAASINREFVRSFLTCPFEMRVIFQS